MSLQPSREHAMKRFLSWVCLGAAVGLTAGPAWGAWVDFEVPWRAVGDVPAPALLLDMSFLRTKPAGAEGFVQVRDGRLVEGDGSRWRIWGVNLTGGACFPQEQDAPAFADYLARFGINCVRFHFLDSNWGPEKTLFEWGTDSTRRFNPEQLERLDLLVAELKRRGIYSNFNLNVGRNFRQGDGVVDWRQLGLAKGATLFDPRMIELQREFAEQLLTHVNPHTQQAYRDEPALAIVELVNENSLVEAWFSGRLIGRDPGPGDATWAGVTHHYARQLDGIFNAWLRQKLTEAERRRIEAASGAAPGAPIERLRPEQFDGADAFRFAT
jgi:hypothetical protein